MKSPLQWNWAIGVSFIYNNGSEKLEVPLNLVLFMDQIICPESCKAVMKITAFCIEISNTLQSA